VGRRDVLLYPVVVGMLTSNMEATLCRRKAYDASTHNKWL